MTPHHDLHLRVRYSECDMQGRVFNANYLTWVDMATAELMALLGDDHPTMLSRGIDYVVAAAEVQYRSPATFNEDLVVRAWLRPPGNTSLRIDYEIRRGTAVIAECTTVQVCVDSKTFEKRPWPLWMRDRMPAHAALEGPEAGDS